VRVEGGWYGGYEPTALLQCYFVVFYSVAVVKERCCRWTPPYSVYTSNLQQVADGVCSRVEAQVHVPS